MRSAGASPRLALHVAPSVATATGAAKERLQIIKLANDFAGRPPTDSEFTDLLGKTTNEKLDYFFGLPDFTATYFHKMRLRTESTGTPEADEAARLWTYLAVNGLPMQDLFTADYTVDGSLKKVPRAAEHGKSGILTMPGFIKTKPGLPHYNYSARVASDFLGQLFEVTPEIVASRLPAASTVEHVYATALELSGIAKGAQKGKNARPPLAFVKK